MVRKRQIPDRVRAVYRGPADRLQLRDGTLVGREEPFYVDREEWEALRDHPTIEVEAVEDDEDGAVRGEEGAGGERPEVEGYQESGEGGG